MLVRYPGDQNMQLDQEDDAHEVITGEWSEGFHMDNLQVPRDVGGWDVSYVGAGVDVAVAEIADIGADCGLPE
ncbi:hypothetical protein DPMN_071179 [Dreissena polymorpha]|uniref:Uncharacterized protein n=1 Tax=Dreissena polymorpha TaxID=45954 RepID=A0A9D3Z235_DREPO|nr:hypothetical protein DPMN_071179 [Dreissena polymorpha]